MEKVNKESYFVHLADDAEVLEYDTYDDMESAVKKFEKDGAMLDDIFIIRGVAMRVKLSIEEA